MTTKTKIGLVALIIASSVAGGFAFNAYQSAAAGDDNPAGFFRGMFGRPVAGIDKDSPEWQARTEERQTQMEEWKNMSEEERQAKMEELKANLPAGGEKRRGAGFGPFFGLKAFFKDVDYKVENIANGAQITITSDNPDIVQKIQDAASRMK